MKLLWGDRRLSHSTWASIIKQYVLSYPYLCYTSVFGKILYCPGSMLIGSTLIDPVLKFKKIEIISQEEFCTYEDSVFSQSWCGVGLDIPNEEWKERRNRNFYEHRLCPCSLEYFLPQLVTVFQLFPCFFHKIVMAIACKHILFSLPSELLYNLFLSMSTSLSKNCSY